MRLRLVVCLTFAACGQPMLSADGGLDAGVDAGTSFPQCDAGVTFQQVLTMNLNSCGSSSGGVLRGCHQVDPPAGNLDLRPAAAYRSLVSAPATQAVGKLRVVPGRPLESFLYQKLTNSQATAEGLPMPQGEGIMWQPPPDAQLERLRCWINRGAPND
jgi:hypothetical protein